MRKVEVLPTLNCEAGYGPKHHWFISFAPFCFCFFVVFIIFFSFFTLFCFVLFSFYFASLVATIKTYYYAHKLPTSIVDCVVEIEPNSFHWQLNFARWHTKSTLIILIITRKMQLLRIAYNYMETRIAFNNIVYNVGLKALVVLCYLCFSVRNIAKPNCGTILCRQ